MRANDTNYLSNEQYRDASNLTASAQLHARCSTNRYGWFRWYFDRLELPDDARVLELGCGPGWLWRENRQRIGAGWQLILTDFSPGMLEQARENLSGLDPLPRFECWDAQAIGLPDASCHAVLANHMLYHVPDRARVFSEIRRVLKPGGCLYAATNGEQHLAELDALVRTVLPEGDTEPVFVHASEFTLENGVAQLERHFSEVCTWLYEDALHVTEVEPLLAHVWSGPVSKACSVEQVAQLRELMTQKLAERGHIHIRKATGILRARA